MAQRLKRSIYLVVNKITWIFFFNQKFHIYSLSEKANLTDHLFDKVSLSTYALWVWLWIWLMNMPYEYVLWVWLWIWLMNVPYEYVLWVWLWIWLMPYDLCLMSTPYEYALWVWVWQSKKIMKDFNIDVNIDNFSVNIQHFKL